MFIIVPLLVLLINLRDARVGGTHADATWDNLPHAVFVFSLDNNPLCSGSLISLSVVLTSAMCVMNNRNPNGTESKKMVVAGLKDRTKTLDKRAQTSTTIKSVVHEHSVKKENIYHFDIGAFFLERTLEDTPFVSAISLETFPINSYFFDPYYERTVTVPVIRNGEFETWIVNPCTNNIRLELADSMKSDGKSDIMTALMDGISLSCFLSHTLASQYCSYDSGASVVTPHRDYTAVFLGMISKQFEPKGCTSSNESTEVELVTPVWLMKEFADRISRPPTSCSVKDMTSPIVVLSLFILSLKIIVS